MKQNTYFLALILCVCVALLSESLPVLAQTSVGTQDNEFSIDTNRTRSVKFPVRGNCSMCKKTIEKAMRSIDGVEEASWDLKTKTASVTYTNKVTLKSIQQTIAAAGYDANGVLATEETYAKLPKCCRYRQGQDEPIQK